MLFGDYAIIVECTVRNNGEEGDIQLIADLQTDEGRWMKWQSIFVLADTQQRISIEFPEPTSGAELADVLNPFECSASSG